MVWGADALRAVALGLVALPGRVLLSRAGLLAALPTNASYWNWYGFPANYTQAYMLIQIVGFVCVGIVAGWLLKCDADRGIAANA